MLQKEKATLIYVGDPMCSWCYGVSNELKEVKDHFDGICDFKMLMGGLRPYNKQTMPELKEFLSHHWEDVNKASGQEFNYGILDEADITYDTEPPCRASVVVRELAPEKEFEFFKMIQADFYFENKNMHLKESYAASLEAIGVDMDSFSKLFDSEEYKLKVRDDFIQSGELGVRGFPTLLLEKDGQYFQIMNGFAKSEEVIKAIESKLN